MSSFAPIARRIPKLLLACATIAVALPACSHHSQSGTTGSQAISFGDASRQTTLVRMEARAMTQAYVDVIALSAKGARETKEARVRIDSLQWRIDTINKLDAIKKISDPRWRFAAIWTYMIQLRIALTEGQQKERFGDVQQVYVAGVSTMERQITATADENIPAETVSRIRPEIEQLARGEGVDAFFSGTAKLPRSGALSSILAVPMAPISGLQGVGDTPAAINRFTDTAGDIGDVVANLPERARWQVEMLLLEAARSPAYEDLLTQAKAINQQADQFNATFKQLPDRAEKMLQQTAQMQPAIGDNLTKIESSMKLAAQVTSNIDPATKSIRQTLADADQSAKAIESAAREVRALTADLRAPSSQPSSSTKPADDEDDIKNIAHAAVQIHAAASEIRAVLTDLKSVQTVPAIDNTTTRVQSQLQDLIRQAACYAAALILFFFLLLFTYRLTAGRKRA